MQDKQLSRNTVVNLYWLQNKFNISLVLILSVFAQIIFSGSVRADILLQQPALEAEASFETNLNYPYYTANDILIAANEAPTSSNIPASAKPAAKKAAIELELKETTVKAKRFKSIGPLPGLNLTKEQIPGNIQTITAEDIKELHSLSISDLLNTKMQSVNVNDYQGNPFQMDVTYRGFTASPQLGTPQGLSVFFDGIRVNEPFGDVVNWDLIPMNAISSLDIFPGSNPLFGLNTLGGALSIKSKSGFTDEGVSLEVLAGSYGRKQLQISGGWNNGTIAAFGAGNFFLEDGWRDNSPSKVNQAFGKLEWQGDRASLSLAGLGVKTKLVGNGTVPLELYDQSPTAVFTSPDVTSNKLLQFQLSGAFEVTDTFNITGMVYNRASTRKSNTGDIIDTENFRELGDPTKKLGNGRETCGLTDENADGFPDYYVNTLTPDPTDPTQLRSAFTDDLQINLGKFANYNLLGALNPVLPGGRTIQDILDNGGVNTKPFLQGNDTVFDSFIGFQPVYEYDIGTSRTQVYIKLPANYDKCTYTLRDYPITNVVKRNGKRGYYIFDANGDAIQRRDGAAAQLAGLAGTGYVEGTPTGIITKSNIDQATSGGALQLNWNLDAHKFMVGTSLDQASASYIGKQRLGTIDNDRNVTNDLTKLGDEFYAGKNDVTINDFDGKLKTTSAYFSETWTPTETFNFAVSGRYNYTDVKNSLAPNRVGRELTGVNDQAPFYIVCPGSDLSNCPNSLTEYASFPDVFNEAAAGQSGQANNYFEIEKKRTEKFTYHSFNPSIGATWQATPRLNLYGNWNQGTRVASVIELGCAYDSTVVPFTGDPFGRRVELTPEFKQQYPDAKIFGYRERSLLEGRGCNLPSALSGDPYLPQVVAQTYELGARGKFKDLLEWNISAYQTNVRDDIYLVSVTPQLSFFQDIGATRRQGIEFGINGEYGKSNFSVNYSLTDATFQSKFRTFSANNSNILSNNPGSALYNLIQVKPGDKLPGVPLHNLNATWGYKLTPAWKVSFSAVAHAGAFLRGNENNEHTPGPGKGVVATVYDPTTGATTQKLVPTPAARYNGKSGGYAVVNFRTTYDIGQGWTAGAMVNNLLDKTYFTAGRLGLTPFAPSINGAIGPGGFNYNSSEWLSTQFMSAGAPRGAWFTLAYDFDASKNSKADVPGFIKTEPDRSELPSTPVPTTAELAVEKAMNNTKALPILKTNNEAERLAMLAFVPIDITAQSDVKAVLQNWHKAAQGTDVQAYMQYYASDFSPQNMSITQWKQQQAEHFSANKPLLVEMSSIEISAQSKGMLAVFTQLINTQKSQKKMLYLEQKNGQWKILREVTKPINTLTNNSQQQGGTSNTSDLGKLNHLDNKTSSQQDGSQQDSSHKAALSASRLQPKINLDKRLLSMAATKSMQEAK